MEGYNMKNIYIVLSLLLICLTTFAQKDKFKVFMDFQIGLIPLKVMGTTDVGDGTTTIIDGYEKTVNPDYDYKKVNGSPASTSFHVGFNMPFLRKDNWSIGSKISGGIGYIGGIKNADGFTSLHYEFPEYLYYKHTKGFKYSAFFGYKINWSAIPYSLIIIGAELHLNSKISFSFYGSPFPYKYWTKYSDGTYTTALRIREFGITLRQYFGRNN
jgi:hypothetical protein